MSTPEGPRPTQLTPDEAAELERLIDVALNQQRSRSIALAYGEDDHGRTIDQAASEYEAAFNALRQWQRDHGGLTRAYPAER